MKTKLLTASLASQKKILESFDFEVKNYPSLGRLVNFSQSKNEPIHRWFRYREGFSPSLVQYFIDKQDECVLDPFCGSGTSLVTALQLKKNSIGIDLNPLSTFMAKIKTTKYTNNEIRKIQNSILKIFLIKNQTNPKKPELKIINKAFHPEILQYLLLLREKILNYENPMKDFLLFGWLSIIEKVSNTKKEGNGIKYRSTLRTKNGYIHINDKDWQEDYFGKDKIGFVNQCLKNKYEQMLNDVLNAHYEKNPANSKVINTDNTNLSRCINGEKISKIIFSPPYANSFDYFEIFKLELWMGKFVESYSQLRELRKKSIGSLWTSDHKSIEIDEVNQIIQHLDEAILWSPKIRKMLISYFTKIKKIISDSYQILSDDGKCVIVVGNSAYGNVIIPTDLVFAKIAKHVGFKNVKILVARHLTTSSQQKKNLEPLKNYLRESVLVFEK